MQIWIKLVKKKNYRKLTMAIPIAGKSQVVGVVKNTVAQLELHNRTNGLKKGVPKCRDGYLFKRVRGFPSNDGKVFPGAERSGKGVEPGANGAGTGDAH
jgi:hypothetical protein